MAQKKSRAFVLDLTEYRETSMLLHVLCQHEGRISLVARGLRSPKRKGTLPEPFTIVQIRYVIKNDATIGTLVGIETERLFPGIRANLGAYALANFWLEIVNTGSLARQATPELFSSTEMVLDLLDHDGEVSPRLIWHLGQLLRALGYGLEFGRCGLCGGTSALEHLDLAEGMTVCTGCALPGKTYYPLEDALARIVGAAMHGDSPPAANVPLETRRARSVLVMIEQFLRFHMEHRFRSLGFLLDTMNP